MLENYQLVKIQAPIDSFTIIATLRGFPKAAIPPGVETFMDCHRGFQLGVNSGS